jgi:hypothetical protein
MLWVMKTIVRLVASQIWRSSTCSVSRQRIEGTERLVEQQDVGVGGQRSGDLTSLLHAARQFVDAVFGKVAEPDDAAPRPHGVAVADAEVAGASAEFDVAAHREPRVQRRGLLEDETSMTRRPDDRASAKVMDPVVGVRRPANSSSSVDFPHPEGPTMQVKSPPGSRDPGVPPRPGGRTRWHTDV